MTFSKRTCWDQTSNAIDAVLHEFKVRGRPVIDLTESNPTRCGFLYPPEFIAALADPANAYYDPESQGMARSRQVLAQRLQADPRRILLTSGTSEAYFYLLRLLADPGDKILIPSPSYPLFQFLADLNDVEAVPYALRYSSHGWHMDFEDMRHKTDARTKAVVVVNPNNPTGSYLKRAEFSPLIDICRRNSMALISDEVFWEYEFCSPERVTLNGCQDVLNFCLGGASKALGLPQMKLAWTVVGGPHDQVQEALQRLDLIADTFLSVSTPVQNALPVWLSRAADIQRQISERVRGNLKSLQGMGLDVLPVEGGWYAIIGLPGQDEEAVALDLLTQHGILVHPGYFYDFESGGHLVVSLLPKPEHFARIKNFVR